MQTARTQRLQKERTSWIKLCLGTDSAVSRHCEETEEEKMDINNNY
jgi:hypothetical protein